MLLVSRLVARPRRVPVLSTTLSRSTRRSWTTAALRGPESRAARLALLLDRSPASRASLVLADTPRGRRVLRRPDRLPRSRFRVLWVGAQAMFHPGTHDRARPGLVFFHGTYIPLHGSRRSFARPSSSKPPASGSHAGRRSGAPRDSETLARDLELRNVEFKDAVPPEELPKQSAGDDLPRSLRDDREGESRRAEQALRVHRRRPSGRHGGHACDQRCFR